VTKDLSDLAIQMELHEAAVWASCVAAAAALPGDPLGAVLGRVGRLGLTALCAVDRSDLNRVVALGVSTPVEPEDLDAIWSFYREHGQQNFRIDLSPLARPQELADWISARGLIRDPHGTFKLWRPVEPPLPMPVDVEVRRLERADTDAIAELNVLAWGAFGASTMHAWFGATVGVPGAQHYGIFDGDRLVATGALFVHKELGWFGFDATHPRFRERFFRQAISSVRLEDAAKQGCRIIHAESARPPRAGALRDGWNFLHETSNYSTPRSETDAP
jgi:hypothetical protein